MRAPGTGPASRRRRRLLLGLGLLAVLAAALYVRPAGAAVPTPEVDLRVTKTAVPVEATPGGSLTYTVDVANDGPSGALVVAVDDTLPPGVTAQAVAISRGGCGEPGTVVSCAIGPMLAGDVVTLTITATVANDAPGELTNCATVRNDEDPEFAPVDTDPGNDTSCSTTRVLPVVAKLTDRAGPPLAYVFEIANAAPEAVLPGVPSFTFPAGLRAAGPGQQPRVPGGAVTEVPVAVDVLTGLPTTVVASARAPTAGGGVPQDREPTKLNGGPLPPGAPVLRLWSTSPRFQNVAVGGTAGIALRLENVSAAQSSPATVQVSVPAGLTVVEGPATWNVPALPGGGVATVELTVRAERGGTYRVAAGSAATGRVEATIAAVEALVVGPEAATGRVFLDADGDGAADPGEGGIEGIAVVLRNLDGQEVAAALTDAAGRYSLPPSSPGHVVEVLSEGFVTTTPKIRLARAGSVDFGLRRGSR